MPLAHFATADDVRDGLVAPVASTPIKLVVRCLAERKDGYWQAFSLEFGLAVQGETLADVKHRLESMIESYVYDALVGEDREHAMQLLTRKATLKVFLKYWRASAMSAVEQAVGASKDRILFSEPLLLRPVSLN